MERSDRAAPRAAVTLSDPADRWRGRADRWVVSLFLIVFAFVQRPGWIAGDTKLDLQVDPASFLTRGLSLWDPLGAAGQLQNQAYGYLFPMGPVFALGDLLGVEPWVRQRLWWALILLVAWHGAHRVLGRLDVGDRWSRLVAAFAYALAPRMLMGLGAVSSEIWPMAVAPWILLPLLSARAGSERSAALRSGSAILLLGAVNAVASLVTLVLPLWWILTRVRSVRLRLLGWWIPAVVAATVWWIGPLILLGRYSPPFLDWIESARVTTAVASPTEALRGTTQWLAGINTGSPVWPAGWSTLTDRNAIICGLVLAAFGVFGLAKAEGPWVWFARGGLVIGLVAVTFGHAGGVAPPWSGWEAALLDRALAPFRNNHKFEPIVRLPLAIGLAHGLPLATAWLRRQGAPWPRLALFSVVLALVGQTAAPALVSVVQRGPFLAVPDAWSEAAQWLGDHPDGGRALVLPGGNSSARVWGEPRDEPIQPFATTPWAVRDGVPLGSAGATRILTAIEARVAQGRGGTTLVDELASLGITRVVLAGDQQLGPGRTPPLVARAALVDANAVSVAAFGDFVGGSSDPARAVDFGLQRPVREVEIFDVDTGSRIAPADVVDLRAVGRYTAGPEGAARVGLGPLLFAADPASDVARLGTTLATDTLQRRESSFSSATDVSGPLLTADQAYGDPRSVHDYWPAPLVEGTASLTDQQTVALSTGAARATASSTLALPGLGQGRELDSDAWRAFDTDGDTGWRSSGYSATGQWVEATWSTPVTLPDAIDVVFDAKVGADVAAVTLETDNASVRTPISSPDTTGDVDPSRYRVTLKAPPGPATRLRLIVDAVRNKRPTVRVMDIGAGVVPRASTTVRLPAVGATADVVSLASGPDERPPCITLASEVLTCSPSRARAGEEDNGIRRVWTAAADRTMTLTGTVTPRGVDADRLLARLDGVTATATSRWLEVAGLSPELTVDGDPKTYWASSPTEARPALTLTWPGVRSFTGLTLSTDPDVAGRRPTKVVVTVDGQEYTRDVDRDGLVSLPALSASTLEIAVVATTRQQSVTGLGSAPMPVVIGDVALVGDEWPSGPSMSAPIVVPCGFGPTVQLNGATIATEVNTTRQALIAGLEGQVSACEPMRVTAGQVSVQTLPSAEFIVRSLLLDGRGGSSSGVGSVAAVRVTQWGSTERALELATRAGSDGLLIVRENFIPGWQARIGGLELKPVTVDGWAQGWVVPTGAQGTITLTFAPQRPFLVVLVLGGIAGLVLLVMAVRGRVPSAREVTPEGVSRRAGVVLTSVAVGWIGGVAGLLALAVVQVALRWRRLAVALPLAAAGWVAWAVSSPWPAQGATNRDLTSGFLALVLVSAAVLWRGAAGAPMGPALDPLLDQVPAEGGYGDGRQGRQHDGDPETTGEDRQAQHPTDREHQRHVPQEDPVADPPEIGHRPPAQDA